jgi:hypothetical protein
VLRPFSLAAGGDDHWYVALIADTHVIDPFYRGPEGNREDTESLFKSAERLEAARGVINALRPSIERVFLVGDYFHDYPSPDLDFYFTHSTRLDAARRITSGFRMPVHAGFGNHDYGVPRISREMSHELFRRKFGLAPYYSVDIRGWKFVHLNNFLGDTWNSQHRDFDPGTGSLGEAQLNWFEAELRMRRPTFVFVHYPLPLVKPAESKDYGLYSLLERYRSSIQRVVSGHWHRWHDFGGAFGPTHLVMASTRYDPNAYLIVEIDSRRDEHRLMNIDLVQWETHYSRPYAPARTAAR